MPPSVGPGPTAGQSGAPTFGDQAGRRELPSAGARSTAGQGGAGGPPADCGTITQSAEVEHGAVDIVWIIDGSASMLDEILAVQENITAFANMISAAGIDHHVVMLGLADVAAATPLGADSAHYLYVPAVVQSNNALELLLLQYGDYESFLRPNAPLHFVVVSDDESWMSAEDFRSQMRMRSGKDFIFHAIVSEDAGAGLPCVGACGLPVVCGGFAPGLQYLALADATSGQKISICTADWSTVFGPLQDAVIESVPLPCDYPLPAPPPGEHLDADKVNLEYAPTGGAQQVYPRAGGEAACADNLAWFYDEPGTPSEIHLCPAACRTIAAGGTVTIKLGCATVPLVVD